MLLECISDLKLADGRTIKAGQTMDLTAVDAKLLLQSHSTQLKTVYKDKAKHAPASDKFSRKRKSTQTK